MKVLFTYLRKYRALCFLALILAAINQIFSLLDPFFIGQMLNILSVEEGMKSLSADEFFNIVIYFVGFAIGAAMVSRIAKNFQDYYLNVITQKVGTDIYTTGIKHSLALPYQVFEDQRSGETLAKLQKVRVDTERMISAFVNIAFTSLVGLIFVLVLAFTTNWKIGVCYISTIPIIAILSLLLSKKIKVIQRRIVKETTALAGATTESLRNIELVKSLGLTNQEIDRLNNNTRKILNLELQKVKYLRTLSFIQGTIINLLRNSILVFLIYLVYRGEIQFGQFYMFFLYSFFVFNPLQELGNIIQLYREAEVSLDNYSDLMNIPVEPVPSHPINIGEITELEFNEVSFKHLTSTKYALSNVNFQVNKGQTIAFVGPSGSGKTTLVKMLVGLYHPETGRVCYNKIPSNEVNINELRNQLGFVTQDAQLFSGTLRENLLFVKPDATDQECMDVLNKAACHSLLNRADKGLDTVIGEGGIKVSGGEKQRISIARALLRNPKLLVFDEATSALDSITEEEISETIRNLSGNQKHITIMIAHRLSTIMHADKIYVLEKGNIIESGSHRQLLENKGLYFAMWRQQVGEF